MMESGCEFMKCEYAARDVDNNPVCKYEKDHCRYKCIEREWEKECDSLEIKNADLQAALATANQERDELKTEIADMKKHTWCAYCGHEILIDDDAATKISEHIMTCEKHPLHIALAALTAAQGEVERCRQAIPLIKELNGMLDIEKGGHIAENLRALYNHILILLEAQEAIGGKVKNQPPDLTAGEFNRGE